MKALSEKRFLMEGASLGAVGARIQWSGFTVDLEGENAPTPAYGRVTPPFVRPAK